MKILLPDLRLNWIILVRALLVLAPIVGIAAIEDDAHWLQLSAMTMCTFIVYERSGTAPFGVLLHGMVILFSFAALFLSLQDPALFVLLCAVFAMASVRLTIGGSKLRTLGNFTFVPALYFAVEAFDASGGRQSAHLAVFIPMMLVGVTPTLLLAIIEYSRAPREGGAFWSHCGRLLREVDRGQPLSDWTPVVSIAVAVLTAAALVETLHLNHGEWVIWSAASIIGGDVAAARNKWRDRTVGALIGVSLGLALGTVTPHNSFFYGASVIASLLTLVAFRSYVTGFGARCLFVVLAIIVADGGTTAAAPRAENVALGGLIGFLCVLGANATKLGVRSKKLN